MKIDLENTVAAHICRSTFIASILSEQFPVPGIDSLLVLHIALVYNMKVSPTVEHLKSAYYLRDSRLIETEIVEYANKLDTFLILYSKRYLRYAEITRQFNELNEFFKTNRSKIEVYYPYLNNILRGLINGWDNNFSREAIPDNNLDGAEVTGLHIV